ncbi:MAG: hypothetical protein AAF726_06565 [Planctomycetota bacterium]
MHHALCSLTLAPLLVLAQPVERQEGQAVSPISVSALEFGDDTTLFVADSDGQRLFAYELPSAEPREPGAYNVADLGGLLAAALETTKETIRVHDLAVRPSTGEAFVAVSVRGERGYTPAIARVDRKGTVGLIDLQGAKRSSVGLAAAEQSDVTFWRDVPASTLSITDIDYHDGSVYVSGLSTGEFASKLRRVSFPFEGEMAQTSIEIYHTAHGQLETRAPIRAMTVAPLGGKPTVIAAYTCTPLVTIPVANLEPDAKVSGKTIAELGFGNTPIEVLSFSVYDMQAKEAKRYVMVVNRHMGARLMSLTDIEEAHAGAGITEGLTDLGTSRGVPSLTLPMGAVMQAADQDAQFLLTVRRDLDSGAIQLVSYRKGSYMRISDYISEYNFPDFEYADDPVQDVVRQFQNALKADEGFEDLVR